MGPIHVKDNMMIAEIKQAVQCKYWLAWRGGLSLLHTHVLCPNTLYTTEAICKIYEGRTSPSRTGCNGHALPIVYPRIRPPVSNYTPEIYV